MAASTTNLRNPVNRLHSLHRQKQYVTPTRRDVLCPNFPELFVKTGEADVADTFIAQCDNGDVSCDYREERTGVLLCKRYWADPTLNLELVQRIPEVSPAVWQETEVIVNYERPFVGRTATVLMAVSRIVPYTVDLGNFLMDWKQWYEDQPGDWHQQYNSQSGRNEILNKQNQNGRSFWFNPAHTNFTNYIHEYYVQARGSDDDMYGSVFRYNGKSFYSFEWDSGGLGINGMALYRNVFDGSKWTKTRLAHSPIHWGTGRSYTHKVIVQVINERISIEVHRINGANITHLANLEYYDTHFDAPKAGAWGPMTYSQPNTYFWDLRFSTAELLDINRNPELLTEIPLSHKSIGGGLHLVSEPLSTYYDDKFLESIIKKNSMTANEIGFVEYWIRDTNVPEGVIFSDKGIIPEVTMDKDAQIAMPVFNYEQGIIPFNGTIYSPDRSMTYYLSDTSDLDKRITSIHIRPKFTRIFDTVSVEINGRTIKYMSGITGGEHIIEFKQPMQLEVGDIVSVTYYANGFELEFYKGDYVDTHDKIFKIEGNKLHWHHIPSFEKEGNE